MWVNIFWTGISVNNNQYLFIFIFLLSFLQGCTALQSFPHAARSGDTVALAVGSPLGMSRENTTAIITDIDGVESDITSRIRSIFKLYADPASKVYELSGNTSQLVYSAEHTPWITIVVLDLPSGLPVGDANIKFNTSAIYPGVGSHINNRELSINILPGDGVSNDFKYEFGIGASLSGNLTVLEPKSRAVYRHLSPSTMCPCPEYAAIEVRTSIPTKRFSISNGLIKVIPQDLTVFTGSGRYVTHGVTSSGELLVTFISPDEALQYIEAQFSVILFGLKFEGTPTINSIKYFDYDGNEVAGPASDYTVTLN